MGKAVEHALAGGAPVQAAHPVGQAGGVGLAAHKRAVQLFGKLGVGRFFGGKLVAEHKPARGLGAGDGAAGQLARPVGQASGIRRAGQANAVQPGHKPFDLLVLCGVGGSRWGGGRGGGWRGGRRGGRGSRGRSRRGGGRGSRRRGGRGSRRRGRRGSRRRGRRQRHGLQIAGQGGGGAVVVGNGHLQGAVGSGGGGGAAQRQPGRGGGPPGGQDKAGVAGQNGGGGIHDAAQIGAVLRGHGHLPAGGGGRGKKRIGQGGAGVQGQRGGLGAGLGGGGVFRQRRGGRKIGVGQVGARGRGQQRVGAGGVAQRVLAGALGVVGGAHGVGGQIKVAVAARVAAVVPGNVGLVPGAAQPHQVPGVVEGRADHHAGRDAAAAKQVGIGLGVAVAHGLAVDKGAVGRVGKVVFVGKGRVVVGNALGQSVLHLQRHHGGGRRGVHLGQHGVGGGCKGGKLGVFCLVVGGAHGFFVKLDADHDAGVEVGPGRIAAAQPEHLGVVVQIGRHGQKQIVLAQAVALVDGGDGQLAVPVRLKIVKSAVAGPVNGLLGFGQAVVKEACLHRRGKQLQQALGGILRGHGGGVLHLARLQLPQPAQRRFARREGCRGGPGVPGLRRVGPGGGRGLRHSCGGLPGGGRGGFRGSGGPGGQRRGGLGGQGAAGRGAQQGKRHCNGGQPGGGAACGAIFFHGKHPLSVRKPNGAPAPRPGVQSFLGRPGTLTAARGGIFVYTHTV